MTDTLNLTLGEVHQLATSALAANGASGDNARAIADIVTAAERDECKSHGLFRIPFYVKGLQDGKVRGDAEPEVTELASGVLRVDAKRGYAPLALEVGTEELERRARVNGIAMLGVVECYHVAALWPEVERLAEHGLISMACTQYMAFVAPAGGTEPVYGTNPLAFGWPRANHPPLVIDQASSVVARGEILLHRLKGSSIPDHWALDSSGNPTTDPAAALDGAQLPYGGYKGAAIAMMVELLAGPLIGSLLSFEASEIDPREDLPPLGGEFVMAIDPGMFQASFDGPEAVEHSERLFGKVLEQEGTRLPSDRRYEARKRTVADGIDIPRSLHQQLTEMAQT